MSKKLLVLKGLPACGKSTYAKALIDGVISDHNGNRSWKRVNKDELRLMVDNGKWSKDNEKIIFQIEQGLVKTLLTFGFNVIVDDTNFGHEKLWEGIAKEYADEFEVKFFDTPVMECIERDAKRGEKSVGAKVIMGMYERNLKPTAPEWSNDKQNAYIFDIDGTLALMNGRSPYDYTKVHTDIPNHNITMIARTLAASGLPIIIVSGRKDMCKAETEEWLKANHIPYNFLFMRQAEDNRNDAIIKREIYEEFIKDDFNVLAVFDDRNRVVDMWRSLGLTVCQVNYGFF